jgi:hypothetical protein
LFKFAKPVLQSRGTMEKNNNQVAGPAIKSANSRNDNEMWSFAALLFEMGKEADNLDRLSEPWAQINTTKIHYIM